VHTTDGGGSWVTQSSGTTNALAGVAFADESHGWAMGEGGTILHTTNGGESWSQLHENGRPTAFTLLQNYPNPFNPSTTIAYDLPRAGYISLRVFDLLGREVSVLVDGFAQAGTHRVTFDGSGLASAIYFARLDAGALSQTKKLMLLK
jgi:hypothetical protein